MLIIRFLVQEKEKRKRERKEEEGKTKNKRMWQVRAHSKEKFTNPPTILQERLTGFFLLLLLYRCQIPRR